MQSATDAGGNLDREATGLGDVCLAIVLSLLAFAVRGLTWPAVLTSEGVRLVGPDAHYHLRRILWSVENFPAVLRRDAYVSFPTGGEPIWSPAFDWSVAALARLTAGQGGDASAVESLAVWVPPVLGAATVGLLYMVALRSFGRRVAIVAGLGLCVMPPHVSYSQVGFVDHHAAVALLTTALLGASLAALGRLSDERSGGMPGSWVTLGAMMGASLVLWPGSLLYVGVAQLAVVASILLACGPRQAGQRAAGAAVAHGTAFLVVAPFAIGRSWETWGDLSPVVLSAFQPLWLGLPTVGLGLCALAWRAKPDSASRSWRALTFALALGLPAVAALALPSLRSGIADAWAWFFRVEEFQAVVSESLPLFAETRRSSGIGRANASLTPLWLALPVMLAALSFARRRRSAHRLVALWCGVLFVATLAQFRFANSFSVVWALSIGCCVDLALRAASSHSTGLRWGAVAATGTLALFLLTPITASHGEALGTARRALGGETVHPGERVPHQDSLVEAARWLREHSPPTEGWLDDDGTPAYGVLTAWGDGHVTRYIARRPVVQDNFGDDVGSEAFSEAEHYYAAESEVKALEIADARRVRYVLVRRGGSGHAPAPYASASMQVRLHRLRGSAGSLRKGDHPEAPVFAPALARHRLIYESQPRSDEADAGGRYKLFEIVEGALVIGRAPAGEIVEARVALSGPAGDFEYRAHDRAGDDGRYRIRLPYPTRSAAGGSASDFAAKGPYVIESADRAGAVNVDSDAVRDGARVKGPDLVH